MVPTGRIGANQVDTNGEAYYEIEGTNKKFTIRGTTHIPSAFPRRTVVDLRGMGLGQREYNNPGDGIPVTLVITGSESYGYMSSINFAAANWMRQLAPVIKRRQLRHVVMPGSHDSGMSVISRAWDGMGIPANTQTQGLNIHNQLLIGIRYFDLRIVSVSGGKFWAAHVSDEVATAPLGGTGESLDDIIRGVNSFTSEYPGEIIIFWIRYMTDMNLNVPIGKDRWWSEKKANEFYTKLESIQNRCSDLTDDPKFDRREAREFMDMNGGAGCVLLMLNGKLKDGITFQRPSSGIYWGRNYMDLDDYWAEKEKPEELAAAQIARMKVNKRDKGNNDRFFIMQWQSTPNFGQSTFLKGLDSYAIELVNPMLYWKAVNEMSFEYWPTVIMQDYVGYLHLGGDELVRMGAELQVLAIGLNIYMVSLNCGVSRVRHPLLGKNSRIGAVMNSTNFAIDALAPKFNGIIYANGTVDLYPPADFQLGIAGGCK
jgi:hypothetical protein